MQIILCFLFSPKRLKAYLSIKAQHLISFSRIHCFSWFLQRTATVRSKIHRNGERRKPSPTAATAEVQGVFALRPLRLGFVAVDEAIPPVLEGRGQNRRLINHGSSHVP